MRHFNLLIICIVTAIVCGVLDPLDGEEGILSALALFAMLGAIISFFYGMIQQHEYNKSINKTLREGRRAGKNEET